MIDSPRIPQEPRSFDDPPSSSGSEMEGGDRVMEFAPDQKPGEDGVASGPGGQFGKLKQTSLNQWAVNDR